MAKAAGLPAAAFEFLRGLAANNEKAWFDGHRDLYEAGLKQPMAGLVTAVSLALGQRAIPLEGDPKRSTFRIHRDVRFSKDKSPYKTEVGSVWYRQGSGKDGNGVLYFHLAPGRCFAGAAFYRPEPDVLDSIRERIRVHPDRFLAMQAKLAAAGLTFSQEDTLSRMPRNFEDLKNAPVAPALRMRSLIVRRPFTDRQVQGAGLVPAIAQLGADALPLLRFGWDAIDEVKTSV